MSRQFSRDETAKRRASHVEREKTVDYLLNPSHRHGASKAPFFGGFGFGVEEWQRLAEALRKHGQACNIASTRETGFSPRYLVEGEMSAPDGRRPLVRSVWQFDRGAVAPRLITAYPLPVT